MKRLGEQPVEPVVPESGTTPEGLLCPMCYQRLMLEGATENEDIALAAARKASLESRINLMLSKSDVKRRDVSRNAVDLRDSFRTAFRKQDAFVAMMNGKKLGRDRPSRSKKIGRGAPNEPRSPMAKALNLNGVRRKYRTRKAAIGYLQEWCKMNNCRASYGSMKKAVQRFYKRDTIG
jgi:hypothetical protein